MVTRQRAHRTWIPRGLRLWICFFSRVVALGLVAAAPPIAQADPAAPVGAPVAVGRFVEAGPGPKGLSLLSSAGYGYTGAVLGMNDRHDRFSGRLGLDGRPVPWLGLALWLGGRYDRHSIPGLPSDDGLLGDPRLFVRADRLLGAGFAAGVRAGLWLPGNDAPSLQLDALTPELVGALRYAPPAAPLSLGVNVGYRLDRRARTAEYAAEFSPSDRLALGVSAFDEVLLGIGATVGRHAVQGFAEVSWEVLVGRGHPPATSSPIMLGAGVRAAVRPEVSVEAEIEVSPSARPDLGPGAPLVVVPPRAAVWLGLAYRFGIVATPRPPAVPAPAPAPAPAAPIPAPPAAGDPKARDAARSGPDALDGAQGGAGVAAGSQLRGSVRSLNGDVIAADIEIAPVVSKGEPAVAPRTLRAEAGRFAVDVAPGLYDVQIGARGWETQKRRVQVEKNGVTLLNINLRGAR